VFAIGTMGRDIWHAVGSSGEPAFANSWVNFDAATYHAASFMRDALGFVHVRGLVKTGTVGTTTPIFTLPAGYRPTRQVGFATSSNGAFGALIVKADGSVCVAVGSSTNCYLDAISFSTD
jgi:hypothetical protein